MPSISLFFLGFPRIVQSGTRMRIQRRKALALLAYLAVTNSTHSRDALSALLWPEHTQEDARAGLRRALSDLRKALGEACFETGRQSIRLICEADLWLDVAAFREGIRTWRAHDHPHRPCRVCKDSLVKAVELYRGDFMAGFNLPDCRAYEEWQVNESENLRKDVSGALAWLSKVFFAEHDFDFALEYAQRWLQLDNLEEAAYRQLMRIYASMGKRSAALQQFADCENVLREELGVEPLEETRLLYRNILESEDRYAPELRGGVMAGPQKQHNLPLELIPFIGREKELGNIAGLLEQPETRLLTILGAGGVGKTRLAVEAARGQLENFYHGVFFVSMAGIGSLDSIPPAIADAMEFSFYQGGKPKQQLLNYLENRHLLLVLDNFEHLLDGVDIVTDILARAPEVKILATSRARLNLGGEQRCPLAGLDFPDSQPQDGLAQKDVLDYDAVRLFVRCTRRAKPDFELDPDSLGDVVNICELLEGNPLGIRLAAAWSELLSPTQIAAEIADEIGKSLDFLATDRHDIPDRQRSMRAVFDHSWGLLEGSERQVLAGLSVFRGGFALDAAQGVTGASLGALMVLVDRSLIQRTGAARYSLHALLRQYAAERLGENLDMQEAAKEKHSDFYCTKLAGWEADLKSARQVQTLDEMDLEIENCRAAWEWAVNQGRIDWLDKAMESLSLFYQWRWRLTEAESIFRTTTEKLSQAGGSDVFPVLAGIMYRRERLLFLMAEWEGVAEVIEQHELLIQEGHQNEQDTCLARANMLESKALMFGVHQGDFHKAVDSGKKALRLLREIGDIWRIASWLNWMGLFEWFSGNPVLARKHLEESVSIYRRLGDPRGLSWSLISLGDVLMDIGVPGEGEAALRESIAMLRQTGAKSLLALALKDLGVIITVNEGRLSEGYDMVEESAMLYSENEDHRMVSWSLSVLGYQKLALGDYVEGRNKLQEALALALKTKEQIMLGESRNFLGIAALLENKLDEAKGFLLEALPYRENMARDQISLLSSLGVLYTLEGDQAQAKAYFIDALDNALNRYGSFPICIQDVLPGLSLYLMRKDQVERAVELYAMARAHFPYVARAKYIDDIVGKRIRAAADSLPSDVIAAAEERGRALDPWETAGELLAGLEAQAA